MSKLIRKEVHIQKGTLDRLQMLAEKKQWSVKQVMEELIMSGSILAEKNLRSSKSNQLI